MSEQLQFVIDQIKAIKGPKLVMMIGIPGSGKTTFAEELARAESYVLCSTDYLDPRLYKKGRMFERIDQQARNVVAMGRNIILDQTNLTRMHREARIANVPVHYTLIAVDLNGIELDAAIERVNNRSRRVPELVIRELFAGYQAPSISEGFDHIFQVIA